MGPDTDSVKCIRPLFPKKARANYLKHGVSFLEAVEVFRDELAVTVPDPDHSASESRYLTFGAAFAGRSLVVSYTERGDTIRVISARVMTPREHKPYED
jgi:uncharacterized DUF497 family protein